MGQGWAGDALCIYDQVLDREDPVCYSEVCGYPSFEAVWVPAGYSSGIVLICMTAAGCSGLGADH